MNVTFVARCMSSSSRSSIAVFDRHAVQCIGTSLATHFIDVPKFAHDYSLAIN